MDKKWNKFCCNPFKKKEHWVSKNLRNVTLWMTTLKYDIEKGMKICTHCRLQLGKEKHPSNCENDIDINFSDIPNDDNPKPGCSKDDPEFMDVESGFDYLNASLTSIGESPIIKSKCKSSKRYCKEKNEKVKCRLNECFFQSVPDESDIVCTCVQTEILEQLKDKFLTAIKSEKLQILTVLPKSWSCARIEREFGVSNFIARKAKKLVEEKGVLSTPDPKPGKILSAETSATVQDFYNSDDISRQMPGKKDNISMGKDANGKPIHVQKRLILGNLREVYSLFKSKFSNLKIGFSKFAELRPKNCIIAGVSGTHCVCVCTAHQNIKLMIAGGNLHKITLPGSDNPLKTYKECIAKIMCNPPTQSCFLNECAYCPKIDDFKEALMEYFEENMVENITYKQWITVDRCTFETMTKPVEDFVQEFSNKLVHLKRHDFVAKQQSQFFAEKKSTLEENEAVVTCDFAENYSFVLQDEAQGFHWNNSMATVHPVVVYYKGKDQETGNQILLHKSIVFISDCLTHNTVLVHVFQKKLIEFLRGIFPNLKKLYYFSDGSAAQYKNCKNFVNLCYHKEDFDGIEAEWHFYATAHGKGVCDGVGGTVKRLAAKASLQSPTDNQILTPFQLFQWGVRNIPSVTFFYVTNEEYVEEEKVLKTRFKEAVAVVGTQKFHAFIPLDKDKVQTKIYSFSTNMETHKVQMSPSDEDVLFEEIVGYVACAYENEWWVACVLTKDQVEEDVKVSFLHPSGPSPSFAYPRKADILTVPKYFILCKLHPTTATGRTYTVPKEEMERAGQILHKKKKYLY